MTDEEKKLVTTLRFEKAKLKNENQKLKKKINEQDRKIFGLETTNTELHRQIEKFKNYVGFCN